MLDLRRFHFAGHEQRRRAARAIASERGTATAEFVIWLPLIFLLFGLIADTAMIYSGKAQVLRAVQDTNRAVSVGRIRTTAEAVAAIRADIQRIAPNAVVSTVIVAGIIESTVDVPASDFTSTNLVNAFSSLTVRIFAQHMAES